MGVEISWSEKCVIFAEYSVGLEDNDPSRFKLSWRQHHTGLREVRPVKRVLF